MSEDKKKLGVLGQIVVAVVVTALVGGTAPWWWDKVFPGRPPEPQKPPLGPDQGGGPERTDSPENMSRTEHSLPGDAILHFRVADIQGRNMTILVDYRYDARHGDKVMVGASLKGVPSGYRPTYVPSPREGTATLQLSASEPGICTDIDIFLYEWGRPAEQFARRTFPYRMRFD